MSMIIKAGKTTLAVGMDWRLLPATRNRAEQDARVREAAKENDAILVSVARRDSDSQLALGLFQRPDPEDLGSERLPSRLHSAAAALATLAGMQHVIAALVFRDGDGRERVAVIVVEAGLPTAESVSALDKAVETIGRITSGANGFEGHRVFCNEPEVLEDLLTTAEVEKLMLEDLAAAALSHPTRLTRPPMNLRLAVTVLGVFTVLVLGGLGGKYAFDQYMAKKRAAEARAADPVPKYRRALADQIGRMGVTRSGMLSAMGFLSGYPVWVAGWELKQIDCALGSCRSTWERKGGTTASLVAGRRGEALEAADSSADKAVLTFAMPMLTNAGYSSIEQATPKAQVLSTNVSVYQRWADAGIRLQQSGVYATWPNTGLQVPEEVTLKAQPIEFRLPWVLAIEAINTAPQDVFWNGLSVAVDISSKSAPLFVTLKGNSYAR